MMSWWARWRLKSPASRLFTQPFIQAQIKKIKAPRHWFLWGEFTGDRWILRTKASNAEMFALDDVIMYLSRVVLDGTTLMWWHGINSLRQSDAYIRSQTTSSNVQIMACHLFGGKPLSEPMLFYSQLDPLEPISVKSNGPLKQAPHHGDVTWASWRVKSRATRLFVQYRESIKTLLAFWRHHSMAAYVRADSRLAPGPVNGIRRYKVTPSLVGWAQT